MFRPLKAIFRQHTLIIIRSIAVYTCQYLFSNDVIIINSSTLCFVTVSLYLFVEPLVQLCVLRVGVFLVLLVRFCL
jgi:hypothetical protein